MASARAPKVNNMVAMTVNTAGTGGPSAGPAPATRSRFIVYMPINRLAELAARGHTTTGTLYGLLSHLPKTESVSIIDYDAIPKTSRPPWLTGFPTLVDQEDKKFYQGNQAIIHMDKVIKNANVIRGQGSSVFDSSARIDESEEEFQRPYQSSGVQATVMGQAFDRPIPKTAVTIEELSGGVNVNAKISQDQVSQYQAARAARIQRHAPQGQQPGQQAPAQGMSQQAASEVFKQSVTASSGSVAAIDSMPTPPPSQRRAQAVPSTAVQGLPLARGGIIDPSDSQVGARRGEQILASQREMLGGLPPNQRR